MFLLRRKSSSSSSRKKNEEASARRIRELESELERSKLLNAQLQEQVDARMTLVGEYLYCYRVVALPLLGTEWELRYFVLSGQVLKQYKSAKDLAYSPQEETSVMGCTVEWEGLCRGTHWAFYLRAPSGNTVLRLSALSKPVALKWMAALEAAGCSRRSFEGGQQGARGVVRQASATPSSASSQPGALERHSLPHPLPLPTPDDAAPAPPAPQPSSSPRGAPAPPAPAPAASSQPSQPNCRPNEASNASTSASTTPSPPPPTTSPFSSAAPPPPNGPAGPPSPPPPPGPGPRAPSFKKHNSQMLASTPPPPPGPSSQASSKKHSSQMLASTPVHTAVRFSYLSSERMWHEKHSGLYNLAAVILVATNFRLALENALKYGWRYSPVKLVPSLTIGNPNLPLALCYPIMVLLAALSLLTELVAHRFLLMEAKIYQGISKKELDPSSSPSSSFSSSSLDKRPASKQLQALQRRVRLHEWLLWICSFSNSTAAIGVPWAIIFKTKAEPISAGVLILLACILWMKLVSYHHVCWDLRCSRREAGYRWLYSSTGSGGSSTGGTNRRRGGYRWLYGGGGGGTTVDAAAAESGAEDGSVHGADEALAAGGGGSGEVGGDVAQGVRPGERGSATSPAEWTLLRYPENLTPGHLAYFLAAPTLTYQVNYPRTQSIRTKWLLRRVFELLIVLTALVLLVNQYIEPAVANSMKPLKEMDWLHIVERVLRLSLPNTYAWLGMFYCLFHLWLNIVAELLRFGDREFYKDWWNASTVGEYWRLWNMPVHKWLLRHVYYPAIRAGLSRGSSMLLVFFVSAIFHELVLGVPLHMVRLWAFAGIMLQVPLIMISDKINRRLKSDMWGNVIFWLSFCVVGQPVTMLIYCHDYMKTHKGL